jgi:CSLREA domain-containing protein
MIYNGRFNTKLQVINLLFLLAIVLLGLFWLARETAVAAPIAGEIYMRLAAPAAPILVDSFNDDINPGNMECTLREAIINANNDSDSTAGDCATGIGDDTITFSISGTIFLNGPLQVISTTLTIDGGSQRVVVDGAGGAGGVRPFVVYTTGNHTHKTLTIQKWSGS